MRVVKEFSKDIFRYENIYGRYIGNVINSYVNMYISKENSMVKKYKSKLNTNRYYL